MKLLWSSRSPFVRKVVVVAHELGIADRILLDRVNVTGKETNAEVMRLNPLNKIPTLVLDDGSIMIDSPVIAEYLDETYGKGELFPRDGANRWQVRRLHALGCRIAPDFYRHLCCRHTRLWHKRRARRVCARRLSD